MGGKIKLKGQLKTYMRWPLFLTLLLIAMNIWIYMIHVKAGIVMTAFVFIYLVTACVLYFYNKPIIMNELINFATQYGQIQKQLLEELEVPYALLDNAGKFLWMNKAFSITTEKERNFRKSISAIFPSITKETLKKEDESYINVEYNSKSYRVNMKRVYMDIMGQYNNIVESEDYDGYVTAIYLFDETELNHYIKINDEQKLVAGLIYLDNHEEALESVEEVKRSLLIALIDRKINKYFSNIDGIVKKLEKDKYFVVFRQKHLANLEKERFSILEDVKTVNIGNEMPITVSIGLGVNGANYSQSYEYARMAIDLALGRGGDQTVVKDKSKISYYGGKSQQVEKNTRVKARVKAHALREIMSSKDKVLVMGHKISDVDCFGAAIGIFRASQEINKKAHIVINEITSSVRPLIDGFMNNKDYDDDMFLNSSQALEVVDANTVVIVVDVNRPSFTECVELLSRTKTIVVLDHHRQSSEVIDNAVLSYIEPYASSTCEMVAEILQYFSDKTKFKGIEADCMYAGIMIDTNNFMTKTGVRTFEAAAYLRRNGVDVTRVRKLFRNDVVSYKARAEVVSNAEIYKESFAIALCEGDKLESPTIIGAQSANELLNIIGIRAAFVLTRNHNIVYVSARSIDEINVQVIMERMGGGGHMTIAGAQLMGYSLHNAKILLIETLDKMMEEGDLK